MRLLWAMALLECVVVTELGVFHGALITMASQAHKYDSACWK
jgi:hypothetical protein